jgi:crotonobetainyl-CoA:carnitine CoA-transferase CaiB-like acyl-CoA transferase
MLDAMIAVLGPRMGETLQAGRSPDRLGNENPMRMPAGLFRASDGEYVNLIVQNDNYWAPFCRALEREEWVDDPRFVDATARIANRAELNGLVAERFAERPALEWVERLTEHRVPAAMVNSYAQALSDPQVEHRGLVREVEHPRSGRVRVVGPPWISSVGDAEVRPPPLLGQHTEEVLREWLGRTETRRREDTKA